MKYSELATSILRSSHPWIKAEDLPSYGEFFTDIGALDDILNNSNQLIIGRRGTGKTHLLGSLYEKVNSLDNDSIAVKVSIMEISGQPPQFFGETKDFSRLKYTSILFEAFLQSIYNHLLHVVNDYIDNHEFQENKKSIRIKADNHLMNLMELIEGGKEVEISREIFTTEERKKSKNKKGNIEANAGFGKSILSGKFGVGGLLESGDEVSNTVKIKVENALGIDIVSIREALIAILDVINVETLYILIDEWTELDKSTEFRIQPYFSLLLRNFAFNSNRFAVKIASVWHRTDLIERLSANNVIGVEYGEDIFYGANLDSRYWLDRDDSLNFYKSVLFKRITFTELSYAESYLSYTENDDFILSLFEDEESFHLLIAVSHGIPRDFLSYFHRCTLAIKRDFVKYKISKKIIHKIVASTYLIEKRRSIDPVSSTAILWRKIVAYLERTGQSFFLVESVQADKSIEVEKLLSEKLIHQVPFTQVPRNVRERYSVFVIDYGDVVDCFASNEKHSQKENIYTMLSIGINYPENFRKLFLKYAIDISIGQDEIVICQSCNYQVNKSHPVLKKFSVCPMCSENIN